MSAATESNWTLAVGDVVFVHPDEERTSPQLRGIHGRVIALNGAEAQVELSTGDEPVWVAARLVRLDRRRKRLPVSWEAP
jgi:hypothetical protein